MSHHILKQVDATGVDGAVPAHCVLASRDGQLRGAELRTYRFHSNQTQVPPLQDVALIAWQSPAEIALQCGDIHSQAQMRPWDFSILRPGHESRWHWNHGFQATVLYLREEELARLASEVFDRHVDQIHVKEIFQLKDPVFRNALALLANEMKGDRIGSRLYTDALVLQLRVHLLRHHAEAKLRPPRGPGALSLAQAATVTDYVEAHLGADLSLSTLAQVAGISPFHFARLFKKRFETPPHAYVQTRRLERARHLLEQSDMPLKEIVFLTGFCDQSHLARSCKRAFGRPPSELRKKTSRH